MSQIISVEGNIGSGKSTILKCLKNIRSNNGLEIIFVQETVSEWDKIKDKNGVTILSKFYENQEKYSFAFQMMAYISRIHQIKEVLKTPEELPLPFKILAIQPKLWTPEVVISRHQGLLGNIGQELQIGRAVSLLGPKKVKELLWFHPQEPYINLDKKIDSKLLFEDILAPYFAFRKPVHFSKIVTWKFLIFKS